MLNRRSLSLLLTAILLWSITLLFAMYHWMLAEDDTAARQEQLTLLELSIIEHANEIEMTDREVAKRLDDFRKFRFRPILSTLDSSRMLREQFSDKVKILFETSTPETFSASGAKVKLKKLLAEKERLLQQNRQHTINVLQKLSDVLGMRAEDFQKEWIWLQGIADEYNPELMIQRAFKDEIDLQTAVAFVRLAFYLESQVLQHHLAYFGCDRGCNWAPVYYPEIVSEAASVRVGADMPIKIGVGSYNLDLDPSLVNVVIGRDTLKLGEDGLTGYNLPATHIGDNQVEVKLLVTNPLTGEVWAHEKSHNYYVRNR